MQPLLIGGYLPGLRSRRGREAHRIVAIGLIAAIVLHVAGLWITSPPDVLDALWLASPTPFSIWGVAAMWAMFASGGLALMRKRLRLRVWRLAHKSLAMVIVVGSVVHAALVDGTMESLTKFALCALVLVASSAVIFGIPRRSKQP